MPVPRKPRSGKVREPIQVYLDCGERATLDRLARELDVSRAEVLRRGLEALQRRGVRTIYDVLDEVQRIAADEPPPPPPEPGSVQEELLRIHDEKVAEYRRKYS